MLKLYIFNLLNTIRIIHLQYLTVIFYRYVVIKEIKCLLASKLSDTIAINSMILLSYRPRSGPIACNTTQKDAVESAHRPPLQCRVFLFIATALYGNFNTLQHGQHSISFNLWAIWLMWWFGALQTLNPYTDTAPSATDTAPPATPSGGSYGVIVRSTLFPPRFWTVQALNLTRPYDALYCD